MKKQLLIFLSMAAAAAFGETLICEWDATTPQPSYADGKVTVTYAESGEVATLSTNIPEGDTVVFTGDAIAFANDALVTRLGLGYLVFSNNVAAVGNLIFTGPSSWTFAYPAEEPLSTLHAGTTAPYLAFPGLFNLEDYEVRAVNDSGNKILYSISSNPRASQSMGAYHAVRDGGVITVQLQGSNGNGARCDAIRLWQTDEGVVVSNMWAKYSEDKGDVGIDFTDFYDKQQRLRDFIPGRLTLDPVTVENAREVVLAGSLSVAGTMLVSNRVNVVVRRPAVVDGFDVPLRFGTSGAVIFRDCGDFTNAAAITGSSGEIRYESTDAEPVAGSEVIEWNGDLSTTETILLNDVDLSAITNVTAKIHWRKYKNEDDCTPSAKFRGDLPPMFYRNYAGIASCRYQVDRGNTGMGLAAKLRFRQVGPNIGVRKESGYYSWSSNQKTAADPTTWDPLNDPTTNSKGLPYDGPYTYYFVTNLTFYLSRPSGRRITDTITLACVDTSSSVKYRFRPGANREMIGSVIKTTSVPNSSGEIHVYDRARLRLLVDTSPDWSRGLGHTQRPAKHFVYPGGEILTLKEKHNAVFQTLNVSGGKYLFNDFEDNPYNLKKVYTASSWVNYVGHVVYSDGGWTTGDGVRLGAADYASAIGDPSIEVKGSVPCLCDNEWDLCYSYTADTPAGKVQLKVADVTGDAAVDFTMTKMLRSGSGGKSAMTLIKSGDGTVLLCASNNLNQAYPVSIAGGRILMGVNDCFVDMPFSLDGGALACAANTTNTVGAVSVTAGGGIELADGASLRIGDCSAQAWAAGTRVNIVGDEKKCSIRFGESAAALTAAQVRQLRWNGKRCMLDEDGNLVSYVSGMVYIVK